MPDMAWPLPQEAPSLAGRQICPLKLVTLPWLSTARSHRGLAGCVFSPCRPASFLPHPHPSALPQAPPSLPLGPCTCYFSLSQEPSQNHFPPKSRAPLEPLNPLGFL